MKTGGISPCAPSLERYLRSAASLSEDASASRITCRGTVDLSLCSLRFLIVDSKVALFGVEAFRLSNDYNL